MTAARSPRRSRSRPSPVPASARPRRAAAAPDGVWHAELVTLVLSLSYSYPARRGRLDLPAGCGTDRGGAIRLFAALDPKVRQIETWAGGRRDTVYCRTRTGWIAARSG